MRKAWVLLTFPTCTQLIYSLQSHYRLTQPSVSPVPCPLATSSFPLHRTISIAKFVRVHLTNIGYSSVTCVTQEGIWTAFSHPLPLSHMESGNAPYASRATSYPSHQHSTFAFLPPSSILTLIKILQKKNDSLPLISAFPGYPLSFT